MSGERAATGRTRILIVSDGLRGVDVATLIRTLEENAIEVTQAERLNAPIPLRILDDFPAPILYAGEPRLKGSGRSELAQLRKRAMHMKAKKP